MIQWDIALAYALGLVLLYLIGWLVTAPTKWLIHGLINGIIGGLLLFAINWLGADIGIHLAVNIWTALIAGFFGLPGVGVIWLIGYL